MHFRLHNPVRYISFKNIKSLFASPKSIAITLSGFFIAILGIIYIGNRIGIFSLDTAGADPVAYWKFDEGVGSTANDFIASNHGSLGAGTSSPTWVTESQCISEKCLVFDGNGDYIGVPDNDVFTQNAMSWSFWIRPTRAVTGIIISKYSTTGNQRAWNIYMNPDGSISTNFSSDGSSNQGVTTSTVLPIDQWHQVEVTYNAGNINIYFDGLLVKSGTSTETSIFNSTNQVTIGRLTEPTAPLNFGGYIDEIKIYGYVRTAAQVKADYASRGSVKGVEAQFGNADTGNKLSSGLVGYWKMDENTGTSTTDSSGNNITGNFGSGTAAPAWAMGKFGTGLSYDGTADYVSLGNNYNFGATDPFTFSIWGKTTDTGQLKMLFDKRSASDTTWFRFAVNATGTLVFEVANSYPTNYQSVVTTTTYEDSVWHNFVATRDTSGNMAIYVDGVIQVSGSGGNFDVTNTTPTYIGASSATPNSLFKGTLDEARIYNRALSPSEITALYNFTPGPVAYWKMDEGHGTTLADASGIGNTGVFGTGNSAPTWSSGKFGKALRFDGTQDQVTVADNDVLTTNTMTWETWMKPDSDISSGVAVLLSKYDNLGGDFRSWTWIYNGNGGSIGLVVSSDGLANEQSATTGTVSAGVWHHIAATYNSGSIIFYIDGKYDSTTSNSQTSLFNNSTPVKIGSAYPNAAHFKGLLDDIRIYNYVRTPGQIVQDMNAGHPAPGSPVGSTVLNLKMDEGYGTTVNDSSTQHNNAALGTGGAAPTWTNNGKFGKALSFDGTDDYVDVPDSTSLDMSSALTISAWIKPTTFGEFDGLHRYGRIVSKGNSGNYDFLIEDENNDGTAFLGYKTSSANLTQSNNGVIQLNTWQYVAVTVDGSTINFYQNGKNVGSVANTDPLTPNSNDVTIGNLEGFTRHFQGSIDQVKMYSFAFTPDQIKVDYAGGNSQVLGALSTGVGGTSPSFSSDRSYCVPGDSSTCNSPVAEWKFNEGHGSTATDTSTNGNTGTFGSGDSSPTWVSGKLGKALSFDNIFMSGRTGDYISVGNPSSLQITGPMTISTWFKAPSPVGFGVPLFMLAKDDTGNRSYGLYIPANDTLQFYIFESGVIKRAGEVTGYSDNKWHYVVGTFDGAVGKLYVDNIAVGSTFTASAIDNSPANVFIGTRSDNSPNEKFQGTLDEMKIYNYARTPAQIAWDYNKGAPLAYYKMDECSGTVIKDWGPNANGGYNGNTGTLTVGASGTQTAAGTCTSGNSAHAWNNGATGKREASLNFDGTDDYVEVADANSFDITGDITVSAWVKMNNVTDERIVSKWAIDDDFRSYLLYATSSGPAFGFAYENSAVGISNAVSTGALATNRWYYVTGMRRSNVAYLYVDGVLRGTGGTITGPTNVNTTTVTIGNEADLASNYWSGQIDEVKIFNYALTKDQIRTEMAGGAVRFQ